MTNKLTFDAKQRQEKKMKFMTHASESELMKQKNELSFQPNTKKTILNAKYEAKTSIKQSVKISKKALEEFLQRQVEFVVV